MIFSISSVITLLNIFPAVRSPSAGQTPYQVTLDYGTFQGTTKYSTGVVSYLGIPFAHAPRFDHAYLYNSSDSSTKVRDATNYGPVCPQQQIISSLSSFGIGAEVAGYLGFAIGLFAKELLQSEDCLSINVQIPSGTKSNAELPVVMWIHGGANSVGGSSVLDGEESILPGVYFQGANLVARSVQMNQPIIFVSANYRLNAFGLSGGREILDAGVANLAIEDQRLAMKWIQNNIAKFGGSPDKVTIWGVSSGAYSVSTHLVLNNGDNEGLFRGAVAFSGGPMKVDNMDRQQPIFDSMVTSTGCTNSNDVLKCLRKAKFEDIYAAVQEQPFFTGYNSLAMPWVPRPDGVLLTDSPHRLFATGNIADVPIMIGDMKDEGTFFSLTNFLNTTTDAEFKSYFKNIWWPNVTDAQMETLMDFYPADPFLGSPFDTGMLNALGPQYKRISALSGDYSFQSQRRQLLNLTASRNNVWSYETDISIPLLSNILPTLQDSILNLPALGSFHVADAVLYAFDFLPSTISQNTLNIMSTLISFVATLDPNNHGLKGLPEWPVWADDKKLFRFRESGVDLIDDTYREEAMAYINEIADSILI